MNLGCKAPGYTCLIIFLKNEIAQFQVDMAIEQDLHFCGYVSVGVDFNQCVSSNKLIMDVSLHL